MNVLIVDDEIKLAEALAELLKQQGFVTELAHDGAQGLTKALDNNYDLILLDVMMPVMDGYEMVKRLRANKRTTPVLMLTAKEDVASRVEGLDAGADDYLAKPFDTQELLARIRALTRRSAEQQSDTVTYGDITLNFLNYTLQCNDKSISLAIKEFGIMKLLLSNPNKVFAKDAIIAKVWGPNPDITENNLEAYMSFLRKKLTHLGSAITIKSKRMLGYCLESTK